MRWGLVLCLCLAFATPALAIPEVPAGAIGSGARDEGGDATVEARLLFDAGSVANGGTFRAGVLFEMERGWHVYWRNSGDTGFPTRLDWKVEGAKVGPTHWPAPEAFIEEETLRTYGYEQATLLFHEVRVDAAPGAQLDFAVDADFLVCKVQCIPGRISLERSLPVTGSVVPADAETRALFDEAAARVPVPAERLGITVDAVFSQDAVRPGDAFRAAVSLVCEGGSDDCPAGLRAGTRDARESFAPLASPSLRIAGTGSRAHPFADGVLLTLEGEAYDEGEAPDDRLRGVAQLRDAAGDWHAVRVDLPLPRAEAGASVELLANPWLEPEPQVAAATVPLWQAFLLALLGGLVLNGMPCVLPVLAIKVFGVAERVHEGRRALALHGAAYTAGILVTMGALAALVIGLRAAGSAVGWGFQFQEPIFLAAISSLLVAFALNLFGVFEVGLPSSLRLDAGSQSDGLSRSFFEGLLAVLLATPCSAPFLGTAVGFAFASPAPVIVAIFAAIGLGLAAPFVAVSLIPGLARFLPRSGPWMLKLRAGLGFALLGTVVWLLWIAGRVIGTDGMSLLLGHLLALAAVVCLYGSRQQSHPQGRAPGMAVLAAGVAALGLFLLPLEPVAAPVAGDPPAAEEGGLDASPFTRQAVSSELAAGRAVFVYFTADWCLTCKVNERVVLRDERVLRALEDGGVGSFVADWTRRDETIRAELARFGRAGVPMYLVYDPARPNEPELLPELLTVDRVLSALERATRS